MITNNIVRCRYNERSSLFLLETILFLITGMNNLQLSESDMMMEFGIRLVISFEKKGLVEK